MGRVAVFTCRPGVHLLPCRRHNGLHVAEPDALLDASRPHRFRPSQHSDSRRPNGRRLRECVPARSPLDISPSRKSVEDHSSVPSDPSVGRRSPWSHRAVASAANSILGQSAPSTQAAHRCGRVPRRCPACENRLLQVLLTAHEVVGELSKGLGRARAAVACMPA